MASSSRFGTTEDLEVPDKRTLNKSGLSLEGLGSRVQQDLNRAVEQILREQLASKVTLRHMFFVGFLEPGSEAGLTVGTSWLRCLLVVRAFVLWKI